MSDSLQPHGLYPARVLCPWDSPSKNTGEGSHTLLQMKVKEEHQKASLKPNIKKTNVMASGPTTSWQIEGEKVEAVTDFLFLGSKITADGDCSQEIR